MTTEIPRYVVWSVDNIHTEDAFQRRWLLRQILIHGRSEDIRKLDINEVSHELDSLDLPADLHRLWKDYLEFRYGAS